MANKPIKSKQANVSALPLLDRAIGFFSPSALNKRILARQTGIVLTRQYDAAQSFSTSQTRPNNRSANAELRSAISPIRGNVRDLIRNAPFATKAQNVIVNGVVGWGIEAQIKHADPEKQKQINDLWLEWSGGLCSIDGMTDFAGLQNQVMSAIVADGEVILKEIILDGSVRLQVLESDYIKSVDQTSKSGERTVSGIVVDQFNRPKAYHLFTHHPGEGAYTSQVVDAASIIHVFRQDRPGQLRGVSWFAPVLHTVKSLAELQWTQLMRLKLSAAITAVVTSEPSPLTGDLLKEKREEDSAVEPGSRIYLNQGEKIEFPTLPNPEGFEGTAKLSLREIASGMGITYEALSGDLSQVNFSSGRLGDLQFRANVDQWRWHLLVPRFLKPSFERFKKFCALRGVDVTGVSVSWTPPARAMISPVDEVSATTSAIRAGLQTLPQAIRELGFDPDTHLAEVAKSNEMLDKLGLIFDSDPRRTGNQQLQSPESLAAAQASKVTKP